MMNFVKENEPSWHNGFRIDYQTNTEVDYENLFKKTINLYVALTT